MREGEFESIRSTRVAAPADWKSYQDMGFETKKRWRLTAK